MACEVFEICRTEPLNKDYELKNQMNRSSGSIMDNIAEGFERGGKKEFIQFLYIAKGSAAELRSQLYRCLDRHYINDQVSHEMIERTRDVSRQLGGFLSYLKSSEYKGPKFVHEPSVSYEGHGPDNES